MSPQLISMPPLLKTVYIDRLQREKRTKRKIGQEVERMLVQSHYKVVKQELKSDPSMMEYEALVQPYDTIKPLCDEELKKVEKKKRSNPRKTSNPMGLL